MRPRDVGHKCKLPRETLINADVQNVRQMQLRGRVLIEKNILKRSRQRNCTGAPFAESAGTLQKICAAIERIIDS